MSVESQVSNIEIVSVDGRFGNQHLVCVDTTAGSGLAGTSFNISSRTEDFYVWFDDGAASDPAPGGTGIGVTITGSETAVEIADKVATALEAEASFNAKALTDKAKVIIEVKGLGAVNSAFADNDAGVTLTVLREGSLIELGFLDGDVELTLDEQVFDITSHQTGTQVIGSLRTGVTVGPITMQLKETTAAKLKEFLESSAATEYEVDVAKTVTTIGSLSGSKQFSNTFDDAKTLVLHPTKKADNDLDEDFCFWKAYPNLSSLTFSGESNRLLAIDFNIFLDERRINEANQVVIGTDNDANWQDNFLKG